MKKKQRRSRFDRPAHLTKILRIVFVQGPHVIADDAKVLDETLSRADVFSPEGMNLSEREASLLENGYRQQFQMLSAGDARGFDLMRAQIQTVEAQTNPFHEFSNAQDDLIFKHRVPVFHIERHSTSQAAQLQRTYARIHELNESVLSKFFTGKLDDAVGLKLDSIHLSASEDEARERNIIENAPKVLGRILKAHPQLASKPELTYVVSLGADHTRPAEELAKQESEEFKVEVVNEFQSILPSSSRELREKIRCGESVTRESHRQSLAQSVLEDVFGRMISPQHPLSGKYYPLTLSLKAIAAKIPFEQIDSASGEFDRLTQAGQGGPDLLFAKINSLLSRNNVGVRFPTPSVESVNQLLRESYPQYGDRFLLK